MNSVKEQYRDISPVTLQIAEENVTSSLYCGTVHGLGVPAIATLVEAFLVEVYRCRVCQFTSALRRNINTHLVDSHHDEVGALPCLEKDTVGSPHEEVGPSCPALPCLEKDAAGSLGEMGVAGGEDGLDQSHSPYNLEEELHAGSKHSDDDPMDHMGLERMSFLLPMYGMLPNISPRSCDMGLGSNSDGSLHVAETCEVSTLFEEEEEVHNEEVEEEGEDAVFRLKGSSVDLSCPMARQERRDEEMAQSAHLMTLGLCRISTTAKAPAAGAETSAPAGHEGSDTSLEDKTPPLPAYECVDAKPWRTSARRQQRMARERMPRRTLLCILCPAALPSRRLLEVHVRCHDGDGGFKCPRCGWRAEGWKEMEPHWKNHWRRRRKRWEREREKKGSRPFSCGVCLRTFRNAKSCDAHEQKHGQTHGHHREAFKTEKSTDRLYKHILSKHRPFGDKQTERSTYGLDMCTSSKDAQSDKDYLQDNKGVKLEMEWCKSRDREVKGKSGRKDEEEKKNEGKKETSAKSRGKEFCCALCNRKFSTKLTMRRHMGIHQGEKPYVCPHCDYSTRLKASLVQHIRIHTGEKPYKCPHCPYASIDSSSLRRHSRTHTQEKPYQCQYCSYSSIQKKSLDLHARRHHTGESFPCHLCQYSSPDRQLLLRHVRKYHSSEQPPGLDPQSTQSSDTKPGRQMSS